MNLPHVVGEYSSSRQTYLTVDSLTNFVHLAI